MRQRLYAREYQLPPDLSLLNKRDDTQQRPHFFDRRCHSDISVRLPSFDEKKAGGVVQAFGPSVSEKLMSILTDNQDQDKNSGCK